MVHVSYISIKLGVVENHVTIWKNSQSVSSENLSIKQYINCNFHLMAHV